MTRAPPLEARPAAAPARPKGSVARVAVPLALVVLVVIGWWLPGSQPSRGGASAHERPRAGADAVALLDGLGAGDALGAWKVAEVRAPEEGRLPVLVLAQGASVTLWVVRKGQNPHPAPSETERYALFYSSPYPSDAPGAKLPMAEPLEALATRVRKVEASVPTPAGL